MTNSKTIREVLMRVDAEAFPEMPRWKFYGMVVHAETTTIPAEPATTPEEHAAEKTAERAAEKPDVDRENRTGRKPPKKGPCVRCGRDLPLNRLMLCYRCWVITKLEDEAKARGEVWTEGMPHPKGCDCVGLGEHKNADGTARGTN